MPERKLLLCTDMDRTVIPNGNQAAHPDAHERFHAFCQLPEVCLAYVTGRHLGLVKQAIDEYRLPVPAYAITDVGTRIYQLRDSVWRELESWEQEIAADWKGYSHEQIRQLLNGISGPYLQEPDKQSSHKLSYYLPPQVDENRVMDEMRVRLDRAGIHASLIWSVDEQKSIGLLDVLPRNATKLHGIEFLQRQLGFPHGQLVFAGDSGNDMPVLVSAINSVLVANAADDIKQTAEQLAKQNGNQDSLYLARGDSLRMNGNYTAGILEGVWHFCPEFRDALESGVTA